MATDQGGLADILGDQCPDCKWTRGKHRWDCEAVPVDERANGGREPFSG